MKSLPFLNTLYVLLYYFVVISDWGLSILTEREANELD